ncbi:hypothetical protein DFP73DRAFT_558787 [Morchella snyderi]|nr:hypothetical protein DFP73DRAFT_558787 [Morchella snyderi]
MSTHTSFFLLVLSFFLFFCEAFFLFFCRIPGLGGDGYRLIGLIFSTGLAHQQQQQTDPNGLLSLSRSLFLTVDGDIHNHPLVVSPPICWGGGGVTGRGPVGMIKPDRDGDAVRDRGIVFLAGTGALRLERKHTRTRRERDQETHTHT